MDPVENPYNPGAGTRPPALVGRGSQIDAMDITLQRLLRGTNARSQLLTGLRGVGKTVLLNEFEETAVGRGYFHEYIEVSEDGRWRRPWRRPSVVSCWPWTRGAASARASGEPSGS